MFKNIFVATDGSDFARKALNQAARLAQSLAAGLVVTTAETPALTYLSPPAQSPWSWAARPKRFRLTQ